MKRRRVTSYDVAERAGVSRTTVSLVLNHVSDNRISQGTVQRVMSAARDLGYIPDAAARAFASQRIPTIGLLLARGESSLGCDNLLNPTLRGILEVAHEHDYRLVYDSGKDPTAIEYCDGLIVSGSPFDELLLRELRLSGIPVVLLGPYSGDDFPSVACDEARAAETLVGHLAGLGRERIACIAPMFDSSAPAAARLLGYRRALETAALPYDPALVSGGLLNPETGYACMSDLLELSSPPDAVFALNDVLAFGAMAALQADGLRVPQDVALAGFDDIPLAAYASPALTTVRIPTQEMAREAARMLVQLVRGQPLLKRHVLLDSRLVSRASTLP